MYTNSWKGIQKIIEDAIKIDIALGATLSVPIIYTFASTFWIDFLNSDPQSSRYVWPVYQKFARYIQGFRDSVQSSKYTYGHQDDRDIELLSEEEFVNLYPKKMQVDAEKLHMGMKEVIDEEKTDIMESIVESIRTSNIEKLAEAQGKIAKGAHIPLLSFTINITRVGKDQFRLNIPEADHPKLWLSMILSGMISFCMDGKINVRRCAAPDCQKYFIPYSRGRAQKFHSTTCRNRFHTQKRRKALP